MKRSLLAGSVAACCCLGLAAPLRAAEPPVAGTANHAPRGDKSVSAAKPATKCLSDLRAFDGKMEKDGYWMGASGYGYGYPIGGYRYGNRMAEMGNLGNGHPTRANPAGGRPAATEAGYVNARPGYEVRTLVAAANILAQHGQQQVCEQVLATTHGVYKRYVADIRSGQLPAADVPQWRQQQIAAATSVTTSKTSFRSDELIGTEVRNTRSEALGSVDDLVMSPKTGKIAYLVIARGGIFGIDRKYVPVPWDDFKATANVNLLVLDATKGALEAAPHVKNDQFTAQGQFDQESAKVDAYWKAHLSSKANTGSNG